MTKAAMVVRPALLLLLAVVLLLAAVWLLQRRMIYFPTRTQVGPAAEVLPGAQDVTLQTSDGLALGAWLVPPRGGDRHWAVLVANGNAGDRSMRSELAAALAAEGFTVLLFDYRGYGGNPGSPTEAGLVRDAQAGYRYLVDVAAIPPDRLIFFGESLGAAVVTALAVEHPPAGLVLRSPFIDLASVAAAHYPFLPVRALLRDRYPLAEQIAGITVPTAVIYGSADTIVPPEQSRVVAQRVGGTVRVTAVEGADHNDYSLVAGPQLVVSVVELAER
jgi:hypothetical protein